MWTELLLAVVLAAPIIETTPEGDTLVVVPDGRVDLIGLRLSLPVGRLSPWWWSANAAVAWHLPRADPALSARIDALMTLTLADDDWNTTLSARFRTRDFDHAISALQDFLDGGEVDRGALQSWRSAGPGMWEVPQSALTVMVQRLLLDPRDLRRVTAPNPPRRLARLQRTRAALVGLTDRIIGFTGDVTVRQARESAAALLAPPATTQPDDLAPVPVSIPPVPGGERTGWLPGGGQGAVVLARGSLSRTDPDYPALLVALHVLAGGVRSRLLVGLRHEAGLIYSLSAADGAGPIPGLMTISIPTRASQLTQTNQLTGSILADFIEGGITPVEQATAIHALRLDARPATPDDALLAAMEALRHGWPLDHHQKAIDAAAVLSTAQINTFIAEFFSPEATTLLRVLPAPGLPPPIP